MAKETKQMRLEREATERAERETQARESYLPRLMLLLERAQKANFNLSVEDGVFVLTDRDERDYDRLVVSLTYEEDDWDNDFNKLTREVEWKEERSAEENRKYLAKQVALAKLSKEEKELLGL